MRLRVSLAALFGVLGIVVLVVAIAAESSHFHVPHHRPIPTGTAPPPFTVDQAAGFVERQGTQLTLDGQPYKFTGMDIYAAASTGACVPQIDLWNVLSEIGPGQRVFRFFLFQDMVVSGGSFDWARFDRVLVVAHDYNEKVIVVLANEHSYCDGPAKDLSWYQSGYATAVEPGDIVPYRQYVADVVARYAGNPTIAMWQLVNEGEAVNPNGSCDEAPAFSALLAFSNDLGGLIHSLDPNHLVSLGTIAGYSGTGQQWCGAANGDYQKLMASPGNDVCDFHDYGYPTDPMGNPTRPDLATAISMCSADGKPIMVAETGIHATSTAALAARAQGFSAKFSAEFQAGVVGELLWGWIDHPDYVFPVTNTDYGIAPGDPSLRVLGTY